jgi:erythronate-4-phosphate dehydrogenase
VVKIIADENMPALDETFAPGNELIRLAGRDIKNSDVKYADVLLVRSITQVDEALLKDSSVRFVGSATIGIDHLDTAWMETNKITWANAPGCNADAAAQYTLAMMWLACERLDRDFLKQSVGVIGRGNVGSRLVHLLKALDMQVLACDPPLQAAGQADLVSMEEACSSDIVSLHIPLTSTGPCPTLNLFDQQQLSLLKDGTLLVNAARGGVIDASALYPELQNRRLFAALDVWPNEPFIKRSLLDVVCVATPHVAGSSVQGKRNGTTMIFQAFCQHFPEQANSAESHSFRDPTAGIMDFTAEHSFGQVMQQLMQSSCPVARDDLALRSSQNHPDAIDAIQIDSLRSHYPRRHEFTSWAFRGVAPDIATRLTRLGFTRA